MKKTQTKKQTKPAKRHMAKSASASAAPDVDVQVEVKADSGLSKIYDKVDRAYETVSNLLTEVSDYVEEHKLSRETVKKTLEDRGMSTKSVGVELSRVFGILKPENAETREQLRSGNITVTVARKEISRPQQNRTTDDRLEVMAKHVASQLFTAAKLAFGSGEYTLTSFNTYLTEHKATPGIAWNEAKAAINKATKKEAAKKNGKPAVEPPVPDEVPI